MLVRDRMTTPVLTLAEKTPVYDALALMKSRRIRRLPVMRGRRLVGIVTWTDLMRVHPSPATSLAVWEIPGLLLKTHVAEVMTRDVLTVTPGASIEEAAVLMRQHKIGGLPVVEERALVGILTESDVFDAFIELMGLRRGGARLTIALDADGTGRLQDVVRTIQDCHVDISSLSAYHTKGHQEMVVRVNAPYPLHVVQTLTERGLRVTHLGPIPEPSHNGSREE